MYMKVILVGNDAEECTAIAKALATIDQKVVISGNIAKPSVELKISEPATSILKGTESAATPNPAPAAQPVVQPSNEQKTNTEATTAVVTIEDVKNIAQKFIEGGKKEELRTVLTKYGAKNVATIPADKLADVLTDLKAIKL